MRNYGEAGKVDSREESTAAETASQHALGNRPQIQIKGRFLMQPDLSNEPQEHVAPGERLRACGKGSRHGPGDIACGERDRRGA